MKLYANKRTKYSNVETYILLYGKHTHPTHHLEFQTWTRCSHMKNADMHCKIMLMLAHRQFLKICVMLKNYPIYQPSANQLMVVHKQLPPSPQKKQEHILLSNKCSTIYIKLYANNAYYCRNIYGKVFKSKTICKTKKQPVLHQIVKCDEVGMHVFFHIMTQEKFQTPLYLISM